jgi:hypothetical protein
MLLSIEIGELSRVLAHQFMAERVLSVSRAALGLTVLLECWRNRRGVCRVALPAAVCHEVVVSVVAAGCEPVFCDVDPSDGLVTESEWVRARARGANAAIVVHLYGNPASTELARSIFPASDCLLIDDAAQALGSSFGASLAGGGGDVGLLSFGATKHIATGNAALLFKSAEFAEEVSARLQSKSPQPSAVRDALTSAFRVRLDIARAALRESSGTATELFRGLLEGLEPVLAAPLSPTAEMATVRRLATYAEAAKARIAKKELWSAGLAATGLKSVGMGRGCVPWRYTCRLPGASWSEQHRIAERIRGVGIHVSNWYIPAHWFLGGRAQSLPGVETLGREVFQFWLDDGTAAAAIEQDCIEIRRIMS